MGFTIVDLELEKGKDPYDCSVSIKEKLFDAVTTAGLTINIDDFDVRVINDSPYDFVIDILCEGTLILDKDSDFRKDYVEYISDEYRVNCFILDEAYCV